MGTKKIEPKESGRRGFLKGALAASAATIVAAPGESLAQTAAKPPVTGPSSRTVAAETMGAHSAHTDELGAHIVGPGSDFMVDVMKAANIEYVAMMTSSALRGLQESIANYGGNSAPEMIVCCHEEATVGMAHGYAKMSGKPMACMVHATVGLQHASMAIYNAWCDRVPLMVIAGNTADGTKRREGVEWIHTAQDQAAMVRDFIKWDDTPGSLQHYAESFMRAKSVAMTPPMEPVLIVADGELQEMPMENRQSLRIPKAVEVSLPVGDSNAVARAAAMLVAAANPVIVVDRAARSQEGVALLVKLAEALNAPVIDLYGRMNFPTNHYLNHTSLRRKLIAQADVILALEVGDLWGLTSTVSDTPGRSSKRLAKEDAQVIAISANYLYSKSNYGDIQRYQTADLTLAADAQATLPSLIEAIKRATGSSQSAAIAARKQPMQKAFLAMRNAARNDATRGWDASPISTARLSQEIWAQIKNEKWALVSQPQFESYWPQRLWDFTEYQQFIGGSGGFGVGYGLPAAAGAALACKREGRIAVNIQPDGDLLMVPSVLWTLAHHKIPLLTIMHNNRAWHQETMHIQRMSTRRNRNPESWRNGTLIEAPFVDFAMVAKGMGVWAEGPISDPALLGPAIKRALAVVKSGLPALIDVVTQPR
ncbi:MAG: thiamine pyrophosphate-binding protein [Herminiimonas sp.]|nr:thiamine pyrophosphate-binding protein [Herminiimonas sp.]